MARRGQGNFPGMWGSPNDLFTLSPFTLMRRLTEDMDRMFSGVGANFGGGSQRGGQLSEFIPPVEVREENNALVISAELPGTNKEDVNVEINNDTLVIQGERKREWNEEQGGVHRSERVYGSFYRQIPLPEGVNAEQAKAEFNNGVLQIRIPVPASARQNRQIPIESGSEQRKPATSQAAGQTQQSKTG